MPGSPHCVNVFIYIAYQKEGYFISFNFMHNKDL